jgi:glycerophosphoryl diester phosphodiesterase
MNRVIQMSCLLIALTQIGIADPLCIAHRGYSANYPANSLAAITNGWRAGASIVEVDVRMTSDKQLVLHHDATANDHSVARMRLTELRKHAPDVVLLADVLRLATATNQLLLDLKSNESDLAIALHREVTQSGISGQSLLLQSPSTNVLATVAQRLPDVPRFYVSNIQRRGWLQRAPRTSKLKALMNEHHLSGVTIKGRRFITRHYLNALQQNGRKVFIWTVNDPNRIKHYVAIGADGIITDNPQLLQPTTP